MVSIGKNGNKLPKNEKKKLLEELSISDTQLKKFKDSKSEDPKKKKDKKTTKKEK